MTDTILRIATRVHRLTHSQLRGPRGPAGPSVPLSDTQPAPLGTAASGVGTEASRSDHVHPMPTAAQVGALAAGDGLAALDSAAATKLGGIAAGAEVNVNADWNASTGDAAILNKPTLGTAAAQNVEAFATAAQGTKADTALQIESDPTVPAWAKQPSPPSYTAVDVGADPTGTAASAITAHETALDPHSQYTTVSEASAAAPVQSVAGRTGYITLTTTDIGGLGTAATANTTDFATAAQGAKADTALQPADGLAALDSAAATKLAGIAAGATANATDAQLRDRSTHTGTQPSTTISGLGDAATRNVGTTAGTVAAGDDARLSDARPPTAHSHPSTNISDSTATGRAVLTAADPEAARDAIGTLWGTIDPAHNYEMVLGDETIDLSQVSDRGPNNQPSVVIGREITVDARGSNAVTAEWRGNYISGTKIIVSHSTSNTIVGSNITAAQTDPPLSLNPNVGAFTAFGAYITCDGQASAALGYGVETHGYGSTSLGTFSRAKSVTPINAWPPTSRSVRPAFAAGCSSRALHDNAVAIGTFMRATHPRSIAIGADASPGNPASHTTAADSTVILTNRIEMIPHVLTEAGAETYVILRSPDGARWRVGVDNSGALTVSAAPT